MQRIPPARSIIALQRRPTVSIVLNQDFLHNPEKPDGDIDHPNLGYLTLSRLLTWLDFFLVDDGGVVMACLRGSSGAVQSWRGLAIPPGRRRQGNLWEEMEGWDEMNETGATHRHFPQVPITVPLCLMIKRKQNWAFQWLL